MDMRTSKWLGPLCLLCVGAVSYAVLLDAKGKEKAGTVSHCRQAMDGICGSLPNLDTERNTDLTPLFSDPETIPFQLPYTLLPDGTVAGEAVISCTAGGDIRIGLTAETYVDAVVTVLGGPYDISDWQGRTVELSKEPVTITLRNPTPGDASSCSPGGYSVDVKSA
ncbi:hypothetical protein [Streptomyces sp. MA25(2023)]|uniref:hypothetical protein n=1 Tax=Streptomyces TaxID=1883 RepID=UPI0025AED1CD|nr:hypothetical protein [Streptomyces sp. MA25(2023)]MDN3254788.1 hypothetical protein [Streptomyces sp. MA25(2023)]